MTIEMAEVMSRVKTMRQRAKRLLAAVLPHAIALETIELEEDIIALIEMIDKFEDQPSKWKAFMQGLSAIGRSAERDDERERRRAEKEAEKENRKAEKKAEKEARKAEKEAKKAEKEAKKEAHRKEKEARKEAKKAKTAEQEAKENELKAEQAKQSADEARATIAETEKREEK